MNVEMPPEILCMYHASEVAKYPDRVPNNGMLPHAELLHRRGSYGL